MKIVIIHGQSHKGSTYYIAHMLAEKISGDIKEFFLPRDFGEFCIFSTKTASLLHHPPFRKAMQCNGEVCRNLCSRFCAGSALSLLETFVQDEKKLAFPLSLW